MPQDWGITTTDVVEKDGKNYYRDVYIFTNRLRVVVLTRDAAKIRQNLDICLRGEAEQWWNIEVDEVICIGLIHHLNGVEQWCQALEKRFKTSSSEAFNKFNSVRFTVEDVRSRRSPAEYVNTLVAAAKGCGQGDNGYSNVIQAWMHINIPLRRQINEPLPGITIHDFIGIMLRKQVNWHDEYTRT